jgi:hypothetical protein
VWIKVGNLNIYWFDAFLVFLLVLGVDSWLSIAPVDLQSRIEHYVLAPLLIVFALVMLLLYGQVVRPLT